VPEVRLYDWVPEILVSVHVPAIDGAEEPFFLQDAMARQAINRSARDFFIEYVVLLLMQRAFKSK